MKTLVNEVNMNGQALKCIKQLANARDIGGYRTSDGKTVKKGMIFRSAQLSQASKEELEILSAEYKVAAVIDIRNNEERKLAPDPEIPGADNIYIDMSCDSFNVDDYQKVFKNATGSIGDMIKLLEVKTIKERLCVSLINDSKVQKAIYKAFKILINNEKGSILIHCRRGITRAGVISALFLSILGVDIETILKDFELTNEFCKEQIDYYRKKVSHLTDEEDIISGVQVLEGTDVKYLEDAFLSIEVQWGTVENYIKEKIGLTEGDINILKKKYLI